MYVYKIQHVIRKLLKYHNQIRIIIIYEFSLYSNFLYNN